MKGYTIDVHVMYTISIGALRWQIGTNQPCGVDELPGRNLYPLSTLCVVAWIVWGAPFTSGALECRQLRRANPPITAWLARHDMEVEVGCFLSTKHAVVLER